MNEAETRAELIDPKLKDSGWGELEDSKILREFYFTIGKIQTGGKRAKPLKADYVITYKNQKLAVVEAKSDELPVGEGVAQAKNYADKLHIPFAYSSNGNEIYEINMTTGEEKDVTRFPTPAELWQRIFVEQNTWRDTFNAIPFEDIGGTKPLRFYQEIAVNKALWAIADGKDRILLTLATGTGKTFIAFQIAWKLFYSRWNLKRDGSRRPRILFLADRNILADQAFNAFNAFPEDALVRISPAEIRNHGRVPTNGSIFFTIFQTFMSGPENSPYFGEYPKDYFDFIVIDECHRGGANDESNWRAIMEYFSPAVQLGLTATPKRKHNIDTYKYFGEPVYLYSLKEGINDGFLTPFKVKRIQTTIDEYVYTSDDTVIEGEVEEGRIYVETDFNRIIEIKAREKKRVEIMLSEINQKEKTIIFCATQDHALAIRDLVNQLKESSDPNYCQRVTANDGALGEQHLRDFQDNERTIPTILTTSQKLSTGVDARNIRNIVLLRPINTMIEFKQIVGRGTRLFEGKDYFTIYDFVNAYHHFSDPEWDGEPLEPEPQEPKKPGEPKDPVDPPEPPPEPPAPRKLLKIRLRDGKEREIQHMIATSFWNADGKPISVEEFLINLYGKLPEFFNNEDELRQIWSVPSTRKSFLEKLEEAGYGKEELSNLQKLINAEKSDLFDVLEYVSFAIKPITRVERVAHASSQIFVGLNDRQKDFLDFVLSKYIEIGVSELDQDKLPSLLELKYHSITDAAEALGGVESIKNTFIGFQKYLYQIKAA
ncbi:MAG: restriction endonuclease subunit R [Candidatus Brocadia sp. WS118]|nr:MAG: restriction endonuclease subunit R [Candidatus Brocadia sp. WS118]